jgi:hypothetical protein
MIVYVGADKIKRTVEVLGARTVVNVTADSAASPPDRSSHDASPQTAE